MPRLAHLDAPGVLQHIIIRGIERRKIFRDDKDRDDLIDRLSDLLPATKMSQPGVGNAVYRGEKIAKEHKYQLL